MLNLICITPVLYFSNVYFSIWLGTINTYLKLEIRVECREFLALNTYQLFFWNKTDDCLFLYIRNLANSSLKPVFRYTISICIYVGEMRILDRWILCCRKIGVKCAYSRFLMYKSNFFTWIWKFYTAYSILGWKFLNIFPNI